jgi:hypothetical protein
LITIKLSIKIVTNNELYINLFETSGEKPKKGSAMRHKIGFTVGFTVGFAVVFIASFAAIVWGSLEFFKPASQIMIIASPPIPHEGNFPALEGFQACGLYAIMLGLTGLILLFSPWFRQRQRLVWIILFIFATGGWGGVAGICRYYKDASALYLLIGLVFSYTGLGLMAQQFFGRKVAAQHTVPAFNWLFSWIHFPHRAHRA